MPVNPIMNTTAGAAGWASSVSTHDFLRLLAAQMANQDVMNPSQDTEFITQLAQFTSLDTMQTLSQIVLTQYGASLVGKTVVVAQYDGVGKYTQDQGVVDRVNFSLGSCVLTVNGREYALSSVMEIVNPEAESPPAEETV